MKLFAFHSSPILSSSLRQVLVAGLLCGVCAPVLAQDGRPPAPDPWSVSISTVHQFDSDLETVGELAVTSYSAELEWKKTMKKRAFLGLRIGYKNDSYDFSGLDASPWGDVESLEIGVSYFRVLENDWQVFVSPSISSSAEDSMDSDSLTYALVAGGRKQVSDTLSIGLGTVLATGLEDTQIIPFLSVKWDFAENWSLQNPMRPGPTGPAGLEVAYSADHWSIAAGAAYRSWRFRLSDDNPAANNGIAEYRGLPLFMRYATAINERIALDLFAGAFVGAELQLEDEDGHSASSDVDVDAAPFIALSISGSF